MAQDFQPVRLSRDGKTKTASTPSEEVQLRYDGWVEPKKAASPKTESK